MTTDLSGESGGGGAHVLAMIDGAEKSIERLREIGWSDERIEHYGHTYSVPGCELCDKRRRELGL